MGVDPGTRWTGLAVCDGPVLLDHRVLENPAGAQFPVPTGWIQSVVAAIVTLAHEHQVQAIALETLNRPSWHVDGGRAAKNPSHVIGTAQIVGAVQAGLSFLPVHMVTPGRYGKGPNGMYPPELISAAERRQPQWQARSGGSILRHARSAFDIARQGRLLAAVDRSR